MVKSSTAKPYETPKHIAGTKNCYNDVNTLPGAIGFDRMATVTVACTGCLVGLLKNRGKR